MGARELHSAAEVISALGGGNIARLTGRKAQHVWNWKDTGRLPPNTYVILQRAIAEAGYSADPSIWGMTT